MPSEHPDPHAPIWYCGCDLDDCECEPDDDNLSDAAVDRSAPAGHGDRTPDADPDGFSLAVDDDLDDAPFFRCGR
jgi:hypothetical protein